MQETPCYVTLPISEIIALYGAIEENNITKAQNAQYRREIEGLRNLQNECMLLIGELRHLIKTLSPADR